MQALNQWVLYRLVPDPDNPKKPKKVPYQAIDPTIRAKTTEKSTWASFEQTIKAYEKSVGMHHEADGIGFIFNEGDPFIFIDLDEMLQGFRSDGRYRWVIECGSYTEISQSGTGLHIIVKGTLPEGSRHKNPKAHVEIYDDARMCAFTGNVLSSYKTIMPGQTAINKFLAKYFPATEQTEPAAPQKQQPISTAGQYTNAELWEIVFEDSSMGAKLQRLHAGDTTGYQSQSEADQAVYNKLAFYTGNDAERMLDMFSETALYREEKERNHRKHTIPTAIRGCHKAYNVSKPTGKYDEAIKGLEEEAKTKADTPTKLGKAAMMITALRNLGYDIRLNQLEDIVEINGVPLSDIKRSEILLKMVDQGVAKTYVEDCLNVVAVEQSYHPIQDYLYGLKWDGIDHLSVMLQHMKGDGKTVTYPNGDTAPLHWLVIRRWLLGCVARALDGDKEVAFKHQTPMLVFVGAQDLGKSSWVRWLCSGIGYTFHRESPLDPHNQDHIRSAVNKWIWEVSELGATLRKGDRDALKGFITQEWHTYRKPYGKANITKPTLACLVGTLNPETGFLDDPTGHRRFLPVNLQALNHNYANVVDINQLWAQMVHLYKNGESPKLTKLESQAVAGTYEEHEVENPLQTYLQMYFTIEPGNKELKCFTAQIILRLQQFNINISTNAIAAGREINNALAPMKLTRTKLSINGIKAKGWVGIAPNERIPPRY